MWHRLVPPHVDELGNQALPGSLANLTHDQAEKTNSLSFENQLVILLPPNRRALLQKRCKSDCRTRNYNN